MSYLDEYKDVRTLATGEVAGLYKFLFTWGLMVGLDEIGYRTRFCYNTYDEAKKAIDAWDGKGFPPGFWIKQKGEVEITNPLLSKK